MIGDENQYNGNYDMYALAEDYTGNVANFSYTFEYSSIIFRIQLLENDRS